MIIKVKDKIFCVIVPQKSGISTITNILGYPATKDVRSKSQTRRTLRKQNRLLHIGGTLEEELDFAKENNIKIDYLYAVVRDPIDRFKSSYKDRVLKKNKDQFENQSLDFAIYNLGRLIKLERDFGKHARPQSRWLGSNPQEFDQIFSTYDLNTKFKPLVEEVAGISIPDIRENVSNDNITVELTPKQEEYLEQFYSKDYLFINSL
jgi:hypothetical protein